MKKPTKRTPEELAAQRKKSIISTFLMILIAVGGTFGFFYILRITMKNDNPLVVVISESMEPNINKGDLLIIKNVSAEDIKNGTVEDMDGDVILYDTHGVWDYPIEEAVVHRVVNKWYNNTEGKWYFWAKGDNNQLIDPPNYLDVKANIPEENVIGIVVFRIPKVGWLKIYLDEENLTLPLIVILGILLAISIVWDIIHPEEEEDDKEKKGRKQRESSMRERVAPDSNHVDNEVDLGI